MKKNGENERYFKKIARIYREEKDVLKMQYFNKLRDSKKYKMFCIISFIAGFGVLSYTIFYLIIDI